MGRENVPGIRNESPETEVWIKSLLEAGGKGSSTLPSFFHGSFFTGPEEYFQGTVRFFIYGMQSVYGPDRSPHASAN
jgi:hypothetical protein